MQSSLCRRHLQCSPLPFPFPPLSWNPLSIGTRSSSERLPPSHERSVSTVLGRVNECSPWPVLLVPTHPIVSKPSVRTPLWCRIFLPDKSFSRAKLPLLLVRMIHS